MWINGKEWKQNVKNGEIKEKMETKNDTKRIIEEAAKTNDNNKEKYAKKQGMTTEPIKGEKAEKRKK